MRLAVIGLLAACGSRTYTGPRTTNAPSIGVVALDHSKVAIEVELVSERPYTETGGILGEMLVGTHENEHDGTDYEHEPVGAIVVDLRTGGCSYQKGKSVEKRERGPRADLPVQRPEYTHWVGSDGTSVVLADTKHHEVILFDEDTGQWRTINYVRCHPWPTRAR